MQLFDTHAHYNDEKFEQDREEIIKNIYQSGVTKLVNAGYSLDSSKKAVDIASKYDWMYTICGISPNDIADSTEKIDKELTELEELCTNHIKSVESLNEKQGRVVNKIVAIGEIGLDYYWNKENKELQKYAFVKQIEIADMLNLPIVIHSREAVSDTLQILKESTPINKGIFHCCPLNRELVKEALKLGFYISFAGPITFKNSKNADEIISIVPFDRMLIETDSPYLAPEPIRGTRNDSRNVRYIAEKIAKVRNMTVEEIAQITYENAETVFKIK